MDITFDEPFFTRGDFPPSVFNGSQEIPVPNPWGLGSNVAPFDQRSSPKKTVNIFLLTMHSLSLLFNHGRRGWRYKWLVP